MKNKTRYDVDIKTGKDFYHFTNVTMLIKDGVIYIFHTDCNYAFGLAQVTMLKYAQHK